MPITEIKKLAKIKNFPPNTLLFSTGDQANGFYYILSGEVRIYKMDNAGKEIEVGRLHREDFFGEAIIFVSDRYQVYAETLKPTTLYFFSKKTILKKINSDPALAQFFIKLLAAKCVALNKRMEALIMSGVKERLIKFLLQEYQSSQKKIIILKIKKSELARQLGTISETLSRNLNQLKKSNLIKVSGKTIEIIDLTGLQKEIS
ncbi:MAG: Crp/Fnr family transcriptional regulator [Parachlamydiales bacterium]